MANCIIGCTDDIPLKYDNAGCAPVVRKHGFNYFVLIKCDTTFTDIMDADEWASKIASGDIVVSPSFGAFAPGQSTTATIPDGCGNTYPEFMTTPWTFTTYSTEADYEDEDWWYALSNSYKGYLLFFVNCDGRLYMNDAAITAIKAWTTGALALGEVGFDISLTSTPQFIQGANGAGKAGLWTVSGEITHDKMIRSVEIPGVYAALTATVAP